MWDKRWERVDNFFKKWKMAERGENILLGISGGADSICLARYFIMKRETLALNLYAVHVNHMLRGEEAKRDEEFVRDFCRQWNIPLHVEYRDIKKESQEKKCSEEEAGRFARYECFEKYARQYQCSKIAVAHHQNDAAETILFRMLRGTGVQGMAGILPVNGKIIRPFLCLSREEITDILKNSDQDYVNDSSNKSEEYSRNYIRHRILPEMESVNQKATAHISELGMQMQELLDYITPKMDTMYQNFVVRNAQGELFFPEKAFFKMSVFEQKEMLRRMLFEKAGHQKDISLVHIEQLCCLMKNKEGKQQNCPYGVLAKRVRDGLLFTTKSVDTREEKNREQSAGEKMTPIYLPLDRLKSSSESNETLHEVKSSPGANRISEKLQPDSELTEIFKTSQYQENVLGNFQSEYRVFIPEQKLEISCSILPWKGGKVAKRDCVKYFDYDKMKCKPCLRTRESGDYFIIDKEGRHKSLGRYFIDTKIPASERDGQLLLADGSHVMWILGGRISEFYKVSSETRRVLKVSVQEWEESKEF